MYGTKIFIIGPHNESRYNIIKNFIDNLLTELKSGTVTVMHPKMNWNSDRLNDWIFGQIDTSDLIIADLTSFNANVIYEAAFAHTLGTPCIYIKFPDHKSNENESIVIRHYFKYTLIIDVTEEDLINNRSIDLQNQITHFLTKPSTISGKTILSDYYDGAYPVDSEFIRGLAEGYHKNFLGPILKEKEIPEQYINTKLYIAIPDTFETNDALIKMRVDDKIGDSDYVLYTNKTMNTLGRPLGIKFNRTRRVFFDIPTTILTVTQSPKYKKIRSYERKSRDKLTDILSRKFVLFIWELIRNQDNSTIVNRLHFVWLSEIIGHWEKEEFMNDTPFERPDDFPLIED